MNPNLVNRLVALSFAAGLSFCLASPAANALSPPQGANSECGLLTHIPIVYVQSKQLGAQSLKLAQAVRAVGATPNILQRMDYFQLLSERMGRSAIELLEGDVIDPEVPFYLGKDTMELGKTLELVEADFTQLSTRPGYDDLKNRLSELRRSVPKVERAVFPLLSKTKELNVAIRSCSK